MAKSLRSKWKRKMRAEKRVRYGAKEKAKLVKMLDEYENIKEKKKTDEGEHEPATLGGTMETSKIDDEDDTNQETMDTTTEKSRRSGKTLKDGHGSYPVWVSQRKIQKIKNKKGKNNTGKITKRGKKK